jgi:hypothetical protein
MEEKLRIELQIPMDTVLKEKEKAEFSQQFANNLTAKGIRDVKLADTYYLEKRSTAEPIGYLVLLYLGGIADIVGIALAIWTVLKERNSKKEVTVKIGDEIFVKVKGNMSKKDVIELVKEAKKSKSKRQT